MKAWMCREFGDLSVLKYEDVPSPEAGPGQVKLAMRACGVNFADSLLTAGKYQVQPEPPFSPGFEIAGDVVAVGDGVTAYKPGDRVMGMVAAGGYAEEVVADAAQLVDGLFLQALGTGSRNGTQSDFPKEGGDRQAALPSSLAQQQMLRRRHPHGDHLGV